MPSQPSSTVESVELLTSLDSVAALLRVVCDISGLGVATVAEVTEQRWIACAVEDRIAFGLQPGAELDLESTLCNHVRSSHDAVIISDVTQNPTYCDHPAPGLYGWKSYLSVPVFRPNGTFFGTLCAFDPQPAPRLEQRPVIDTLDGFARLLGELLAREEQRREASPGARGDLDLTPLREQLLVLLEEDLQRPLQALAKEASADAAQAQRLQAEAQRLAERSAAAADFVRVRLGHGLPLKLTLVEGVNERLTNLLATLQARFPDQTLGSELPELPAAVRLDLPRLLQAMGALLEWVASRNPAGGTLLLRGELDERCYRLAVESRTAVVDPGSLSQVFQPALTEATPEQPARLELSLYLAQEVARGHGGSLVARQENGRLRFILTLPTALD
ncbi:GAF domain-containing protein [Pseudomonas oryzihabitans]|uniref:GAF domain-containing protein n=1 Tax=Pseudomonas oryzihabitans TaxID=47885 RepID=UPI001238ABFA|nr:GAF domain-containing protein [Pseudomonas oryzihabitans]QEU02908.1 GAF domain-containing sensor histidine kinase [Pseudomonas oryzihabitans]HJE70013.1 GAF domain-containing protein [Pseudomonas oryzihabitans]